VTRLTVAGLALLAVLLSAAPGSPAVQELLFKDPKGGVFCVAFEWSSLTRATIECAVPSTAGDGRYPKQWFLHARGRVVVLRPDNGPVERNRVLGYGASLELGPFRCTMLRAALRCTSRLSGHGFELSRSRQSLF
jgi:hypothetical protein